MSAYLCDDQHIKQLAAFVCAVQHSDLSHIAYHFAPSLDKPGIQADVLATRLANILLTENHRSLDSRYPGNKDEYFGGDDVRLMVSARDVVAALDIKPMQIFKPLDCYEYQSCEASDWDETIAFRLCNFIRRQAIKRLHEYDAGNWGQPVAA